MPTINFPQTCTTKGCCHSSVKGPESLTVSKATGTKDVNFGVSSTPLVQELYEAFAHFPVRRFVSEVWQHVSDQPKRPEWNIQQAVVMGFLQAFRDNTVTNSLAFWRAILVAPTWLRPLTARIEDGSFCVKQRDLPGILNEMDKQEDGTRILECEWMSAGTIWDRCGNLLWPQKTNPKSDDMNVPATQPSMSNSLVLRSHSPEKAILYLHGGAYCAMSAQTHRTLTHKISKSTGRRLFVVNYRLAPETQFPGGLYDAVQAYLHLIDRDTGYNIHPENIQIMGDSAGGGLSLALLLYLRDHGLPRPEGAVLLSPWVDLSFSFPSWDNASLFDYLPNNPNRLQHMNPAHLYLGPDRADAMVRHPYVSPLFADSFENLPPILIQSGGCESLRDEIEALAQKIGATKTTLVHHEVYNDMVHVFQAFPFPKSVDAIQSIGWWIKFGIPMIAQWQERGQLPTPNAHHNVGDMMATARSVGKRFHSIPE